MRKRLLGIIASFWLSGCGWNASEDITDPERQVLLLRELQLQELATDLTRVTRFSSIDRHASWLPAPGSYEDYYLEVRPRDYELEVEYWRSGEMPAPVYKYSGQSFPAWWPAAGLERIATVDVRQYEGATPHNHPVEVFADAETRLLYFHTGRGH